MVQVSGSGSPSSFLGEIRLARAARRAGEAVCAMLTDCVLVRPGRQAPFTLDLLLTDGRQPLADARLTFVADLPEEPSAGHVTARLSHDHGRLRLQADPRPVPLADARRRAAASGAELLFAAQTLGERHGPARWVPHAQATTLDVWARVVQEGSGEDTDEGLHLWVRLGRAGAAAQAARKKLRFGMIRYNFLPEPDPQHPQTARIGTLEESCIGLKEEDGVCYLRAAFRDLAHLDSAFVAAQDGVLLRDTGTGDAPRTAVAFVFCGAARPDAPALRDTRTLQDGVSSQTAEEIAAECVQSASERAGAQTQSIAAAAGALFMQELALVREEDGETAQALEQSARIFGLSPDREEDLIAHANLFLALQWPRARRRLLAGATAAAGASPVQDASPAQNASASPEGGALALVRETLRREIPGEAAAVEQWLGDPAHDGYLLWQAFRDPEVGLDLAAFVKVGAPLSARAEAVQDVKNAAHFRDALLAADGVFLATVSLLLPEEERPWGADLPRAGFQQLLAARVAYYSHATAMLAQLQHALERLGPAAVLRAALLQHGVRDVPDVRRPDVALHERAVDAARGEIQTLCRLALLGSGEPPAVPEGGVLDATERAAIRELIAQQAGPWRSLRPAFAALLEEIAGHERALHAALGHLWQLGTGAPHPGPASGLPEALAEACRRLRQSAGPADPALAGQIRTAVAEVQRLARLPPLNPSMWATDADIAAGEVAELAEAFAAARAEQARREAAAAERLQRLAQIAAVLGLTLASDEVRAVEQSLQDEADRIAHEAQAAVTAAQPLRQQVPHPASAVATALVRWAEAGDRLLARCRSLSTTEPDLDSARALAEGRQGLHQAAQELARRMTRMTGKPPPPLDEIAAVAARCELLEHRRQVLLEAGLAIAEPDMEWLVRLLGSAPGVRALPLEGLRLTAAVSDATLRAEAGLLTERVKPKRRDGALIPWLEQDVRQHLQDIHARLRQPPGRQDLPQRVGLTRDGLTRDVRESLDWLEPMRAQAANGGWPGLLPEEGELLKHLLGPPRPESAPLAGCSPPSPLPLPGSPP